MEKKITLGSGKLYIVEFTGEIPTDAVFEENANLLGLIKGGASLEYTPTYITEKDDLGLVTKEVLTDETAVLKSGILTWSGNTLKKLCATGRVTETATKRTVKIGGVNNQDGKKYALRFLQEDEVDGDARVTIVGKNRAGFTLAFQKDTGTVINAEFSATPLDNEGTLIIYEEEIEE